MSAPLHTRAQVLTETITQLLADFASKQREIQAKQMQIEARQANVHNIRNPMHIRNQTRRMLSQLKDDKRTLVRQLERISREIERTTERLKNLTRNVTANRGCNTRKRTCWNSIKNVFSGTRRRIVPINSRVEKLAATPGLNSSAKTAFRTVQRNLNAIEEHLNSATAARE